MAKGQNPETLFITCSDSRIDPNLLTRSKPGELFLLRNAGNIVPPHGAAGGGEAATIEFAVAGLGVKDIIVCGHSHCGAMGGLLDPEQVEDLPAVAGWLSHAETTRRIVTENYGHLPDAEPLTAAIEENVLVRLEHPRTLPAVASRLVRGGLHLHGWVYKIETGEVFAYDPSAGQFVPPAAYHYPTSEAAVRRRTTATIFKGRGGEDVSRVAFVTMTDGRHADGVCALMRALYAEDPPASAPDPARFPVTVRHLLAHPDRGRIVLVLDADRLDGYGVLVPYWSNEFGGTVVFVDELYLVPAARGRGTGRRFLEWVEAGRPFGAVAAFLEVGRANDRARRLYESVGFRERTYATLAYRFAGAGGPDMTPP